MGVVFRSFGHYVPPTGVGNQELAARFGITPEWIDERTGIMHRAYMQEGGTADMIVPAALQCLQSAGVAPHEVGCIIVATMTPDHHCPSTATLVHHRLGTANAWGFDIMAACSGYLYALQLATALINSNSYRTVLVCGADKMSSCIDHADRKTALILGDGAGVSLLQHSDTHNHVVDTLCGLASGYHADITMPMGGSHCPSTPQGVEQGRHHLRFESSTIFQTAVDLMQQATEQLLQRNGLTFDDIDLIVPHQANKRMIESLATRLNLPISRFVINIEQIGNTSAGTIPIALSQSVQNGRIAGTCRLLMVAVGAGYTYAVSLIEFA